MAHYAILDENNIVIEVITGKDEGDFDWEKFYGELKGRKCLRTSYNTYGGEHLSGGKQFRKNYAGLGYSYNERLDAFIPPKPFASAVLNESTCLWEAPIPRPEGDYMYRWDEEKQCWVDRF